MVLSSLVVPVHVFSSRIPANVATNRLTDARAGAPRARRAVHRPDRIESRRAPGSTIRPICWRRSAMRAGCATRRRRSARSTPGAPWPPTTRARASTSPPDRIVLTASTSDGYSLLFKLLADAGDEVLVPRPSYPLFDHLTRLDLVVAAPLRPRARRRLGDRLRQRRARADAADARGAGGQPEQPDRIVRRRATSSIGWRRSARRAASRSSPTKCSPTTSSKPGAAGARRPRRRRARDVLSFALGGLSKSVGLPQVKLGWIAVGGPDRAGGRRRSSGSS